MRTLVVGHRGCAGLEPENTIRAFKRAVKLGCDAIEMDIHLTKDNVPIVIHDRSVDRTTNGKGLISNLTSSQIKRLKCAKGEGVPTLKDVIDAVGDKIFLVIELKEEHTAKLVIDVIKRNGLLRKVELSSFWHREILQASKLDPRISTGVILSGAPINPVRLVRDAHAKRIHVSHWYTNKELIKTLHAKRIFVDTWTLDEQPGIDEVVSWGVDAITSNYPNKVLHALRR